MEIRAWAAQNRDMYVVSEPVFTPPIQKIRRISIPTAYFKAIIVRKSTQIEAIGFYVPHESSPQPLLSFSCSVNTLERVTGLNFFAALPDEIEDQIEGTLNYESWAGIEKIK